jgi:septum formation protein
MLDAAGIAFEIAKPNVDEDEIKKGFTGDDSKLAQALAEAKATKVSGERAKEWVIGSDSIVSIHGRRFSKPRDRYDAVEHLRSFRGQVMVLTSAVALAREGRCEWSIADQARLHVRDLSDQFIVDYLDAEWPGVRHCVGVFRLEGRGVQLFSSIDGNTFTILGMPLLPLLGALRERGLIAS